MANINSLTVDQHMSIKEAMRIIDRGAIKLAIVVDENQKLVGVVSDGDIRRGILNGLHIEEGVDKVMNKTPLHANTTVSKSSLRMLMQKKNIQGVPLVNDNKVVQDFALTSGDGNFYFFNKQQKLKTRLDKILVIGGGGFIGSILVRKLLAKGYMVNVLDKFIYGKTALKGIWDDPALTIIEGDTRHIEDITNAIQGVDAVVHLAELVGDPACALKPSMTQEINYLATRTVASVCKYYQINRLVYMSSCSVYGASENTELLTEESDLNPVSLYAKMKIASEKALFELSDSNFSPTILRLGTVFGASHRLRFDLVVNLLTAKAVNDGKITVFGGDQWRPNVHVKDVADSIITVLESPLDKVGNQVFNVGKVENNHTINEIGEFVKQGVPTAELVIQDKDVDKRDYKVSFDKIRSTLNFVPNFNVPNGVEEIKKVLEDNPDINHNDGIYSNILFLQNNNNDLTD